MEITIWTWVAFNAFVLGMLAIVLGVFHRNAHEVTVREAGIWSAVWVALALAFNFGIYAMWGAEPALQFLAGYLIEKSLSVDNIFVFVMLFSYFAVPAKYQHRVLFWGILGALVMRGLFIAVGAYMLEQFHWVIYLFGAILVLTGIKMARRVEAYDPSANPALALARRLLPLTDRYHGPRFWVKEGGKWVATPLFLVLLLVEVTDLVFAIDSIPAIFAVTKEPFLVYTANVFAILGLRSMYFLLAGIVHRFVYLNYGLAAVLVFVGVKMLLVDVFKIPVSVSLAVVAGLIGGAIILSLRRSGRPLDGADAVGLSAKADAPGTTASP
ncbi:MAG: TerC family protein [Polaromonas sp.]|nr:TerC family protein [Gemmatimonadaceae bacterium]